VADTGGNVPSGAQKGFDLLHLVRAFDNHQVHVMFSVLTAFLSSLHYLDLSSRVPNQHGFTIDHEASAEDLKAQYFPAWHSTANSAAFEPTDGSSGPGPDTPNGI
jgi:hypothetical protein